jgi:hypothetical protein
MLMMYRTRSPGHAVGVLGTDRVGDSAVYRDSASLVTIDPEPGRAADAAITLGIGDHDQWNP